MKKQFEVTIRYTGSIRYTVEAENEEGAKKGQKKHLAKKVR